MDNKGRELLEDFKNRLPSDLRGHLEKLIVFGSRAGGTHNDDSDLDIAVIVDRKNYEIEKRFEDIAYAVMWDNDFKTMLSIKVLEASKFHDAVSKGYSFYRHIESDGVLV